MEEMEIKFQKSRKFFHKSQYYVTVQTLTRSIEFKFPRRRC